MPTSSRRLGFVRRWGRVPRVTAVSILVALGATLVVAVTPLPASADTQTATNSAPHAIPAGGLAAPDHSASSVYPAPITISGLTGTITKVTARLNGLSHANVRDVEVLLVGPAGQKMIVMADVGGNETVTNISPTFDDAAASAAPDTALGSGTYKPTNLANGFTGDIWPAPAPAPPYATTFAAFNGTNPNGTWNLYLADDASGDIGTLAGGWTLSVETGVATFPGQIQLSSVEYRGTEGGGVAAVTIDRVSGDDGVVGVTFTTGTGTATAGVDYTPVTQTVTFADGDTSETVNIPIADDPSIEGIDELVPISISTPTGGATLGTPTSGQVRIQDNDARANAFPITIPGTSTVGAADPYPSNIVVAGAGGVVTDVDVTLTDVSHTHIRDLDVLLVAPNGATTMLMQDVGPNTPVSGLNLTFSDEAATGIGQAGLTSGTYKPSVFDDELPELLPAPAPAGPYGTTLAALDGTSPNGTWSLYVVDDAGGDIGDIGAGWSLTLEAATASAGGPYTTPEGSGVTLSGSTTPDIPGATYEWDVDGDGQYDDATGQNPTVSAGTLAAIGLGDGPDSSNVRVRVTSGAAVITSTATTLTVTNVAPTATFSNNGPVTLGNTADVSFSGQSDPSTADTTAGFRYSYDFDDDGDWEVGDGTYAGSSTSSSATVPTSVLNAVGTFEVNGRILDKDGGFTDYTTTITVDPPPNSAPVADAGDDQEVNAGDTVTLDGTGSTDPDDDELSYSWVQTAGPAVTLTGANTAQPTFTAPTGPATLTFELTVGDGELTDTDTVTITVNGIPVANAGPDQLVNLGDTVTLDGTGSEDPDSDVLTYSWVQTGGGTVVALTGADTAQPTFTAPEGPDVLAFELTVTDPGGETDTDTVIITVNGPPTANAGPDQDAELGDTVTLDGTGSTDPDGNTLLYSWVQTAGPAVTLVGANTATPSFTAPAGPGVLTFQLTVDDQAGRTDTDEVNVGLNDSPIANAGGDRVADLGQTVTLNGTASSDPEGDPLQFSWIQTAGPAVTLVGANTAQPTFTAPDGPATLTFELTVTDDEGLTDTDTVDVRLNGRPVASAGPDQLVNRDDLVTLDGSGSTDPDGDSISYQWTQTFGPAVALSSTSTVDPSFIAPEGPSELRFRLIVRDPFGRFRTDFVSIVVNGPPTANAGPDRTVDAGASVILSAAGSSDPDGDTLKYQWTQTYGPAVSLSGANTANATFTAPSSPTELRFRLIVRDQRGRFAVDFVQIIVSGPPIANAGPDQTVTSGSLVTLDGTGSSSPVKYQWTQTYGPAVTLTSSTSATPSFAAPVVSTPKELRFRLIVRDGRGRFATDFVHITVLPVAP
jgi:subtilisin-like proprotein convertase family protein